MSFTHTLAWAYNTPGDQASGSLSVTAESESKVDVAFTAPTDQEVSFTLPVNQCKGFFMISDVAGLTVETNSSSAPDQTFFLSAGVPVDWIYGDGTSPVTVTVTKLYLTCPSNGTFKVRALIDATP